MIRRAAGWALCVGVLLMAAVGPASAQEPMGDMGDMAQEMMRWHPTVFFLFEKLEYAPDASGRPLMLEGVGWWGGARSRLWIRADAEQVTSGSAGEVELEVLYGRLISPFFDAFVGARVDRGWGEDDGDTRALLSVGLEGLAPLWWEVSPTLFVSQEGDVLARLEASYALLFTQRLILEPEIELNAALQDAPEFGVAAGVSDLELSGRIRYELHRKFAPYLGVSWIRRTGATADLFRIEGQPVSDASVVAGLRLWY